MSTDYWYEILAESGQDVQGTNWEILRNLTHYAMSRKKRRIGKKYINRHLYESIRLMKILRSSKKKRINVWDVQNEIDKKYLTAYNALSIKYDFKALRNVMDSISNDKWLWFFCVVKIELFINSVRGFGKYSSSFLGG